MQNMRENVLKTDKMYPKRFLSRSYKGLIFFIGTVGKSDNYFVYIYIKGRFFIYLLNRANKERSYGKNYC